MANIRKHRDKWQAQIRLKGIKPITKSFVKRSDAMRWARAVEGEITVGTYVDPRKAETTLLASVIDQYLAQIEERGVKDNARRSRLGRLRRDLGDFALSKLTTSVLTQFRDRRAQVVSDTTIAHELSLLRRLLNWAKSDLDIVLPKGLPHIHMPRLPIGRSRRLIGDEEAKLLRACSDDSQLQALVILAIETAMRRSELINIQPCDIDWKTSTLVIPKTKNGVPRIIPLSHRAKSILESYTHENSIFIGLSPTRASQKFAATCERAGIQGLRLHDLRHEAISRLVERGLSHLEIATISGHRTMCMLARYSHPDPAGLVTKLAACPHVALNFAGTKQDLA